MLDLLKTEPTYHPRRDNTVFCIFGKKSSGKSFLTKEIVAELSKENGRVIAIDSNGEYGFDDKNGPKGWRGMEVVRGFKECALRLKKAAKERRFAIALQTSSEEADIRLIDIAGTIQNQTLVIEETSRYVSAHRIPRPIAELIRFGRHSDISQIYISRRPSEISRELTANADIIITFRQQEPRDLAYLRAMTGEPVNRVRNLGRYKPYVYTDRPEKLPMAVMKRM